MTQQVKEKEASGTTPETNERTSSLAPIWKRQINRVQSAMWKHDQKGTARFTVSISRSFKNEQGKWQTVHYFDSEDLDDVVAIAKEAGNEILNRKGLTVVAGKD